MVRYRRNFVPGGTYFFTVTLADRHSHVLIDQIVALRDAFRDALQKCHFKIDAVVVLPDHLHAILTLPQDDANFSSRLRQIKSSFTKRLVTSGVPLTRRANGEYTLWQRRFWEHTIRNETDLVRHIDYIHFNPVKHQLVARVGDWPYSSFHRFVRQGLLPEDWAGDFDEGGVNFGEREL